MSTVGCLFSLIKLGAWITILLGIAIFGFGIYVTISTNGTNYKDLYFDDNNWFATLSEYGLIIIGVVLLIIGGLGSSGSSRKRHSCRKCFLFIYQIGAMALTLIFLFLAIFTLYKAYDTFNSDCKETDWFKEVDNGVTASQNLFCSTECPCSYEVDKFEDTSVLNGRVQDTSSKEITSVDKCSQFDEQKYGAVVNFMKAAEDIFQCSGWCTTDNIYVFSNINRGNVKNGNCFDELGSYFDKWGGIVGYIFLGLGIYYALNIIFVFLLCCHPEQKKKHLNVYARMQDYDYE